MKYDYNRHLIFRNTSLKVCLERLNELGLDAILFVVDAGVLLKKSVLAVLNLNEFLTV